MSTILGLDLGTDSIGWAIRDTANAKGEEQIIAKGAVIFQKGVGEGKAGEYSLAAERTSKRAMRKLYHRRKRRKAALLYFLIEKGMCPLATTELDQWIRSRRKSESRYPASIAFRQWLNLDFDGDGICDYAHPYALRARAAMEKIDPQQLGRALYHLTQRRGYLSNRTEKAKEQEDQPLPDEETVPAGKPAKKVKLGKVAGAIQDFETILAGRTIGQLQNDNIENGGRARRRNEETTQVSRLTLQQELETIAKVQGLDTHDKSKLIQLIFEQRPLKSQKGTVGKCIYEKNKIRCPVSHPEFEWFRMWQVLNNIKYQKATDTHYQSLDGVQRQKAEALFYRVSKPTFLFADIIKELTPKKETWQFNYKPNQSIAGCPVLARFRKVLGIERVEQLRAAAMERLNWEATEKRAMSGSFVKEGFDLYDLWHLLFLMDNDKDERRVETLLTEKLGVITTDAKELLKTSIKPGYANLSLKAIRKINVWLERGEKYDKAVFMANLPAILGKDRWMQHETAIGETIQQAIQEIGFLKNTYEIANGLIKKYNDSPTQERFGGTSDYTLDADDRQDIEKAIAGYLGEKKWKTLSADLLRDYTDRVGDLYVSVLRKQVHGDLSFYRLPRLSDHIARYLQERFDLSDEETRRMYHPSETESFLPKVEVSTKEGKNYSLINEPRTSSIRNPMAMRTLYQLKRLINFLIEEEQVDENTVVIVEMARELNDANQRKAIRRYMDEREKENAQYAEEIKKIFADNGRSLPNDLSEYIIRYRLWEEQKQPDSICLYTGRAISITALFDEQTIDIDHTLPRSLSFDDSLANKTLVFREYNQKVKKQLLPSQLNDHPDILARLDNWRKKVDEFEEKKEKAMYRTKMATTKEAKDRAIQDKHYYALHLRYWRDKIGRFECEEITDKFKNSQLTDTQIISKYGVLYLKTLFQKVRSTKGTITDKVKRLWGAMVSGEQKDRSNHTHHTIDAIVQTLLHKERNQPDVYQLLAQWYRDTERQERAPQLPNPWGLSQTEFYQVVQRLAANTVVWRDTTNVVTKQTVKKKRNKGKIVYHLNPDGEKVPVYEAGTGIRASLHKDTFYGAVKVPAKDEQGRRQTDAEGRLLLEKDDSGMDRVRYRTSFVFTGATIDAIKKALTNIVDDRLRVLAAETGAAKIKEQGYFEIPVSAERRKREPDAKPTKVYKVKVFADTVQNPLRIKQQRDAIHPHKQWYYVQTDGNYLMALYDNGKERDFELVNTFDLAQKRKQHAPLYPQQKEKVLRGKPFTLPLLRRNGKDVVIRNGMLVLLYEETPDEIWTNNSPANVSPRLYAVKGLSIMRMANGTNYGVVDFLHHAAASRMSDLTKESGKYSFGDGKPFRKLLHTQFNGLLEGIDFTLDYFGTIHPIQ